MKPEEMGFWEYFARDAMIALCIFTIIFGVLGILKLHTDWVSHRTRMDLYKAHTEEMKKLAAEAKARREAKEGRDDA